MFGFLGKEKTPEPEQSYSYDEPSYEYNASPLSSQSSGASGGNANATAIQAILLEEQQRALIQHAIQKITSIAWDKCSASKPESELSSREKDCIKNVTLAYLDTSKFVTYRLNKASKA